MVMNSFQLDMKIMTLQWFEVRREKYIVDKNDQLYQYIQFNSNKRVIGSKDQTDLEKVKNIMKSSPQFAKD